MARLWDALFIGNVKVFSKNVALAAAICWPRGIVGFISKSVCYSYMVSYYPTLVLSSVR